MDKPTPEVDALVEAYLDGQLDQADEQRVIEMINSNPEIAARVELQDHLDGSLRRLYGGRDLPATLEQSLNSPPTAEPAAELPAAVDPRRRWLLVGVAIAASVAWLSVLGQLPFGEENPYERRELAKVYQASVDAGFQPKWVCEDDAEFARTFEQRQGVPLRLTPMPEGRRMVGLSYLDGLSPNATSMLAYVDGEPVIVFVTSRSEDPGASLRPRAGLKVLRTDKLGLVFYEVTPFDEPLVTPFLEEAGAPEGG